MNLDFDAILDVFDISVKEYGSKKLAPEINKAYSTLRNELNPNLQEDYKLGLLTSILIMLKTKKLEPLDMVEAIFGRVAFPLPEPDPWKPCQVMELMAMMSKEFSESVKAQAEGLADGKFDKDDVPKCMKENDDMIKACLRWKAYLMDLARC